MRRYNRVKTRRCSASSRERRGPSSVSSHHRETNWWQEENYKNISRRIFFFPEVRDVIKGLSEILSNVLDVWDVGKLVEMCVFLMHARWKWRIFTALYIFVVCLTTSEAFKAEIVYLQFIYIY